MKNIFHEGAIQCFKCNINNYNIKAHFVNWVGHFISERAGHKMSWVFSFHSSLKEPGIYVF